VRDASRARDTFCRGNAHDPCKCAAVGDRMEPGGDLSPGRNRQDKGLQMSRVATLSLTSLAAALAASAAAAQIGFQPAVSVPAPATPDASELADLDQDGDLDLIVTTDAPDKVTLFFNQGGTFGSPLQVQLGSGTSPHTPIAADLDGDGDIDLAVSLKNTNQVRVIAHNGAAWTPGASFAVGAEPRSMALSDFDLDGDWDLAVSNRSGNSVSFLRNDGGMNFSVATVAVGAEPREIAFGRFSGDLLPDLAVAMHGDRVVRLVVNQGNGAFVAGASLGLGQRRPQGLDAGDLDGDGDLDIAASTEDNGVEFVSVFVNQGAGNFASAAHFLNAGQDGSSLSLADFDDDGRLDAATANTGTNNVSVLRNTGNATLGAAQTFAVGVAPGHVICGDVDKNGSADLIATNDLSGSVSVLRNLDTASVGSATNFCRAKTSSQGLQPKISATGAPSYGAQGFSIELTSAVPAKVSLAIVSAVGPASQPFSGGTLCVQPPINRLPARSTSAAGSASEAVPITLAMVGGTRWYQFWFRDPAHPDGTGVGLSDGLAVTFSH